MALGPAVGPAVRQAVGPAVGPVVAVVTAAIVAALFAVTSIVHAPVANAQTDTPQPPVGITEPAAWILVDADTGRVLASHNPHEPLPPASLAKVMTALVAAERLSDKDRIVVSALAASQPPSKLGIAPGERYRLDDALASLIMESANDMSYAVAETVGGDLDGFADLLNDTAQRFGMDDSELSDPAGLDDEESFRGGPRMSAFDIAITIQNARQVFSIAKWATTPDYTFDGPNARFSLSNHNDLLPGGEYETEGANGFKTGGTTLAGRTLAATAGRDGRTMIAVVLNTPGPYEWARYLFDLGFSMPADSEGTGETIPAPAVSVRAVRERDRNEFVALVTGEPIGNATTTTQPGLADVEPFVTSATTAATAVSVGRGGSGGSAIRMVWIAAALLLSAFVVRREQIKRRKRRRVAARRERAVMIRRGSLPVVDGRYRRGQRTGPAPQAHIRVKRVDAPPEQDWEEWAGWDDEPPAPTRR